MMLQTFGLLCLFLFFPHGLDAERRAYIDLKSPFPLITVNGQLTYQAIRKERIQFHAELHNADPLPEPKRRLRYPRLLQAEEDPVQIGQECTSEPCILNYTILADGYAESKYIIRGVDNTGYNATEDLEFFISVREDKEVAPLTIHCDDVNHCYDIRNGHLIIKTGVISGYPLPHKYYIENAAGHFLLNGTLSTDRVILNLTQEEVNGGGKLTLTVVNRRGVETELEVDADFPTEAPPTIYSKHSASIGQKENSISVLAIVVPIILLVLAVIVIVVFMKRQQRIKSCLKLGQQVKAGDRIGTGQPNADDVERGDGTEEEKQSLNDPDTVEIVDENAHETYNIVIPVNLVFSNQNALNSDAQIAENDSCVPNDHSPSSADSDNSSIRSDLSLAQDGASNAMEELKGNDLNSSETADGSEILRSFPVEEQGGNYSCQRPVQVSHDTESC